MSSHFQRFPDPRVPHLTNCNRALAMDAVEGQVGPPRRADGHGRNRRSAVEPPSAPATRPTQGPTATVSYCPTATARCCSTRCCTRRLRSFRSTSNSSANCVQTPGHPRIRLRTRRRDHDRPLGQGITNAVGWRPRRKSCWPEFNRPGHEIVDHHTYVFLGDGCLMEGISHEACSLAGTWEACRS